MKRSHVQACHKNEVQENSKFAYENSLLFLPFVIGGTTSGFITGLVSKEFFGNMLQAGIEKEMIAILVNKDFVSISTSVILGSFIASAIPIKKAKPWFFIGSLLSTLYSVSQME